MTREELKQSLLEEEANIKARLKLFDTFEDLQLVSFGRDRVGYATKFVNGMATPEHIKLQINRSCGCCQDAVYYVSPFIELEGIKVYALPIKTIVGEGMSYGTGIKTYNSRFEDYAEAGFSDAIIKQIEDYLTQHPAIEDDDDDDDEDDEE